MKDFIKLPRLYVDHELAPGAPVVFSTEQAHYLRNVLRLAAGDAIRVFNSGDGEFLCTLAETGKKAARGAATERLLPPPAGEVPVHLYFAPIRKARMDILVEKAVELGVTDLHPVITARCEARQVNEERLRAQIIEAAEQCERLTVPALHPPGGLTALSCPGPLYACIERDAAAPALSRALGPGAVCLLVGPEGGFTDDEKALLRGRPGTVPVTLGARTLRAETAALTALAVVQDYLHNY